MNKFFLDTEFISKPNNQLTLISIGLCKLEPKQAYYAISREFKEEDASTWVKDNVITKLTGTRKPLSVIRDEIINFIGTEPFEIWTYCGAFDFVLFSWLFGEFDDMPKNIPYFPMELKQLALSKGITKEQIKQHVPDPLGQHHALVDAFWNMDLYEYLNKE